MKIWGQCHFLEVDYGFVTNGSTIRIFIKTGPNQLCFSDLRNWNDADVFEVLLGLCFVSIDHPTGNNKKIKEFLCRPDDRKCDWPARAPPPEVPRDKRSPEPTRSPTPSEYQPTDSEIESIAETESELTDYESEGYETETGRPHTKEKKKVSVIAPDGEKESAALTATTNRVTRASAKAMMGTKTAPDVTATVPSTTTRNAASRGSNMAATTTKKALTRSATNTDAKGNTPQTCDKAQPQTTRRTRSSKEVGMEQPEVSSEGNEPVSNLFPRDIAKAAKAGPSRQRK